MIKVMKTLGSRSAVIICILVLGAWPVGASVPGDIAAGLPLDRVVANGLGAGRTIEAIIDQALEAGAAYCPLLKAVLAQGVDLTRALKAFRDWCSADRELSADRKLMEVCDPCKLMRCAIEAGRDMVAVANAMIAAGADLDQVRGCLAGMGYAQADVYEYSPPEPLTVPSVTGPTFPSGGGGGSGEVGSPSS
jgi:hypothetical protein